MGGSHVSTGDLWERLVRKIRSGIILRDGGFQGFELN